MKMHAQSHISGQVPIQAGSQFSELPQPNGSSMSSQMQSQVGLHSNLASDFDRVRQHMREIIYAQFQQKQRQPPTPELQMKLNGIVRRLEEHLYRNAATKEEYINRSTLEHRLHGAIRFMSSAPQTQQLPHSVSSSSSVGTMMPTPGIVHRGKFTSVVSSSMDNSMISGPISGLSAAAAEAVNMRSLLSTSTGPTAGVNRSSLSVSDASISDGYQSSTTNIPIGSGGNNLIQSAGLQSTASQMIPTPGLSNSSANSEPVNNFSGFSGNESTSLQKSQQPKQYVGGHNSRILQNLGGQMGIGVRSSLQKKSLSYGFPNGIPNGGLGSFGSNVQLMQSPAASEGFPTASPRPTNSHSNFDHQRQQHLMQTEVSQQIDLVAGDGYGMNTTDLSGSEKLHGTKTSVGSTVNNQNMYQNAHTQHHTTDQSSNMNFQPHHASQQLMPKFQTQELHQQPHLFQHQHNLQSQDQQNLVLKNDEHRQSQGTPSLGSQTINEQGVNPHGEAQYSKNAEQFQRPELQNQFQQTAGVEDSSRGDEMLWHPSGQEDFCPPLPQNSRQQMVNQPHQLVESQNNLTCIAPGSQSEALMQGQWHSKSQETFHTLDPSSQENHVQEEFPQRIKGLDEAHQSLNGSITSQTSASGLNIASPTSNAAGLGPRKSSHIQERRWLLFLYHARGCSAPEGKCLEATCINAQQLWKHMVACNSYKCQYPRCCQSRMLIQHYRKCQQPDCPICIPVRHYIKSQRKASTHIPIGRLNSMYGSQTCSDANDACLALSSGPATVEASQNLQSLVKRMKVEHPSPSLMPKNERSSVPVPAIRQPYAFQDAQSQNFRQVDIPVEVKCENADVKKGFAVVSEREVPFSNEIKNDTYDVAYTTKLDDVPMFPNERASLPKQEMMKDVKDNDVAKQKTDQESATLSAEQSVGTKSGKPKIKGVSLTELFTPEEIRRHITGLRQWVGQSKAKAEKNQAMEHSMSENSCQLCAVEKLTFEPPPIYCTSCGGRIKRNAMYYTMGSGDTRHYFCIPCYNDARGDTMDVEGTTVPKARMEKKKNDEETEEWSKAKAEKNQAMEHSMSENSCQLCAVEKLTFEPPPIYCTSCGGRIKRNAMYYTMGSGDTRHYFCIPCYNDARGDTMDVEGTTVPKARMEKKRNDEETEEWWVQCDKCEAWQHQICALFNGRRNDGGQAEYTCPNCYIGEIERGERKPLPQNAVLGAKDLPRTILSDHIEQRLFRRLRQERQDRARLSGKNFDEVPGAEALVVRVVSSVDKKLEVKQRFLEIFEEENYPTEFAYKSKVILLFQKIEGVEVCLFGMYVQEFGSECLFPNQRRVYLSYLDSVKYFRPEIKTVTGEALRTFVYHEILIAYLEYCKRRGFTSCYIWACPPLKGEDYILYCHPEIQKTPKSDKLREWYLSMLRKAGKENIVVDLTNLYDHFFVSTGESKAKVTAARLPYFDGDYWPGAAEDMINQLRQEEDGKKQHKKGKIKKIITKRALRAAGHTDLSENASKDILLMQKLGETISPMKEDFIMVHLQHACTHCCHLMTSGTRWACRQCKNFQLCDKCYDAEQKLEERDRHPISSRDKHLLNPVEVNDVPEDTKDKDEILESEFFDTRQAFLSLCQGNHFQYDTLRRAKHSSMMVLYHLHNPTAPAFVTTCNICHNDIENGQGWRCEICPDYDLCNSCYQKDGGVDHPHKLTNHPSIADRDAQNTEARQLRVLQLRKMLDLLVHASQCRYLQCPYPNCRKVKGLFRHGIQCRTRASGGCVLCKKMWYILQLHARACKESGCHVPRCKDLKEHLKRLQQQSDSRRRAAVMEMMRQRAAEVAGNSG
ncbi:Histone acetyltransferase hac1 [Thalictrum thalictroides]|uniref:histone acetyltransferase n=1 Tax=Thalictrum thalictroides TaxID=46969 RepID=A0A7J6WAC8_THATH|nr:Histone acetyltransferase hac1 [Thalictrum thalictroides]